MEQYDFADTGSAKDIYGLPDCMSDKELEMARGMAGNIRETAQLVQYERCKVWSGHMLFPIFKEYAQMTSSLLQIKQDNGTIDILFRNNDGLDIAENCKGMYITLIMAAHMSLGLDADDPILALTYDCYRVVS